MRKYLVTLLVALGIGFSSCYVDEGNRFEMNIDSIVGEWRRYTFPSGGGGHGFYQRGVELCWEKQHRIFNSDGTKIVLWGFCTPDDVSNRYYISFFRWEVVGEGSVSWNRNISFIARVTYNPNQINETDRQIHPPWAREGESFGGEFLLYGANLDSLFVRNSGHYVRIR